MTVTAPSAGNSSVNPSQDLFSSEESILRALAFVRHSTVSVEIKNALRDLFLAYAGTYGEKERLEVKNRINEILKSEPALSSLVSEDTVPVETPTTAAIGSARPVPKFSDPAPAQKTESLEETPAVKVIPEEIKPTPVPVIEKPVMETAITPAPIPVAETPIADTPAPVTPPPPSPLTGNPKTRIDAIKRDINGKIGNPVNLIDTNEAVGKEYMSALLDAMKRAAKGDSDLTRLETAYQSALSVIQSGSPVAAAPVAEPLPEVAAPPMPPTPTPPPETPAPPLPEPEPKPIPKPEPEKVTPPATQRGLYHRPLDELDEEMENEIAMPIENPKTVPTFSNPFRKKNTEVKKIEEEDPDTVSIKIQRGTDPKPTAVKNEKVLPAEKPVSSPQPAVREVKAVPEEKLIPLNQTGTTLPEQISRLKAEATAREEAAKKPITDLKAPAIDQGLKQLLSEWTLFKSRGFFRTKPGGIDHPLYKQLAVLPMASVIAGRFEGVTPEIKHTLADYMTGWRYEQGVVHDMGETFEHYLRRVVKEILEKQRAAKENLKNSDIK